ncbi:hypothetical protein GA0061093_11919 [Rhodococcus qingshengii]|nr:hypothetical protein GA0061093_11919 [Rhodococcus qingshengii]
MHCRKAMNCPAFGRTAAASGPHFPPRLAASTTGVFRHISTIKFEFLLVVSDY